MDDISFGTLALYVLFDEQSNSIIGCGGLEPHGSLLLVRSLAIRKDRRSYLLARALVSQLLEAAAIFEPSELLVLTSSLPPKVLSRFGFEPAVRSHYEKVMRGSKGWELSRGSDAKLFAKNIEDA